MDEKFFDLKKEKQDRILNAALKIFAIYGYSYGSTETIVKEAGISKGLLFHYFGTKQALYLFLYNYSLKFLQLELKGNVSRTETDYFQLRRQVLMGETAVMQQYPYMTAFLEMAEEEKDPEVAEISEDQKTYHEVLARIMERADLSGFREDVDIQVVEDLIHFTEDNIMRRLMFKDMLTADLYMQQVNRYFNQIAKLTCR